jgi:hypothetical protein
VKGEWIIFVELIRCFCLFLGSFHGELGFKEEVVHVGLLDAKKRFVFSLEGRLRGYKNPRKQVTIPVKTSKNVTEANQGG